jgi:hypothetical protein
MGQLLRSQMHVAVRSPLTGAVKFFVFDYEEIARAALFGYGFPKVVMAMDKRGCVTIEAGMENL